MNATTLTPEEELVLKEVKHHLNDDTITIDQLQAAHGALELDRIGQTTAMPLPFTAIRYLKDGKANSDKISSLSSQIQASRRQVLDIIDDAHKAV